MINDAVVNLIHLPSLDGRKPEEISMVHCNTLMELIIFVCKSLYITRLMIGMNKQSE